MMKKLICLTLAALKITGLACARDCNGRKPPFP